VTDEVCETEVAAVLVLVLTPAKQRARAGRAPALTARVQAGRRRRWRLGCSGAPVGRSAGAAGAPAPPQHVVGACDKLGDAWDVGDITPRRSTSRIVHTRFWPVLRQRLYFDVRGARLAIDPTIRARLLGLRRVGILKTTDCGATWVKIDTGAHQKEIDSGRNWTIVRSIRVIRKSFIQRPGLRRRGLYKSVNGGVDWQQIFTTISCRPCVRRFHRDDPMDPTNTRHRW